ncbi:MAG TPA: GNAT family N-acetyltransferase [Anaeromyxobacteraceae bacterium]|nr:GNAT family N-acetyltransferase [Anaeromyxobacteraceae bacterium]
MSGTEVRVLSAVAEVPAPEWDGLAAHEPERASPFVRHAFLDALEASGSAAPRAGWRARHVVLRRGGRLLAAAPAWLRHDSDGDFSRDWEWAAAAARARVPWYPKLLVGVPFTPATGRRVLVAEGEDRAARVAEMVGALRRVAEEEGARTVQVLFPDGDEVRELEAAGLLARVDLQYHWRNEGYRTFEEFLARFPSKRRNAIRRERAAPARQGIAIRTVRGDELRRDPAGWARDVHALHAAATDRMPWGMRWVNRDFYARVLSGMADAVEVVEARRGGALVAMAFNLASPARLWGRHWGCIEVHPFLHFNVALYHSIEECIRRGLRVFEGGAGGDHKLARGFEPAETWSAHLFLEPRLEAPIRRWVGEERRARREAVERWREEHPRLGG